MPPLCDTTLLAAGQGTSAAVRASHKIYEHLVGMFAPGLIEAAFDLGVFRILAEGDATATELANQLGADPRGVRVLLDGLSCYEIVHRTGQGGEQPSYRLAEGMAGCLLPGGLYSIAGRISYDRTIGWKAWSDFANHVRNPTRLTNGSYQPNQLSTKDYESVARGINFWAPPIIEALCPALSHRGWNSAAPRSMVDVGCGTGIYSQLLLRRYRCLDAIGLDAKPITDIASDQSKKLGVRDRFHVSPCDFLTESWGSDRDLVLLVNIFHLQTEEGAQQLVKKAADAVSDTGLVTIVDHIVDDRKDPDSVHNRFFRLFAASMLLTGGGDAYRLPDYQRWLRASSLRIVELIDTPMHRILLAQPYTGRVPDDCVAHYVT